MSDRLYELLPAIYRIRDVAQGYPLRALLGILEEQHDLLEQDIAALYDDWFIETCQEWVVPYIGGLLSTTLLNEIAGADLSRRALVANTIAYRRRKGTLLVLEELARDATGWGAHAVMFFELLGWTQHLDHQRREGAVNPNPKDPALVHPEAVDRVGTVNLRSLDVIDRIGGPFDITTHTVDIRPISWSEGWHNIRNLGIFLWRLQSYPLRGTTPRRSADYADGFHFSSIGNPTPLFVNPERRSGETGFATETNVAGEIRRVAFHGRPELYYGSSSESSVAVYRGAIAEEANLVPQTEVLCKDLSAWSPPPSGMVAVDVRLGRLAFALGEAPAEGVTVSWHQGFSADIGGGAYDRRSTLEAAVEADWTVVVAKQQPDPLPAEWRTSLVQAIADWDPALHARAIVTIADSGTYEETLAVSLADAQILVIQADDRNRPTLRLQDAVGATGVLAVNGANGTGATLLLSGLLVEGGVEIAARSLGRLELRHTTLVPGRALDETGRSVLPDAASIEADPDNSDLEVVISSCITGPVRLPETAIGLTVTDSIVDSPSAATNRIAVAQDAAGVDPGPPTSMERVTVFGEVRVRTLVLASDTLFTHPVIARRRQIGCVRYSFVDEEHSVTPRRFRCQPDLALSTRRDELGVTTLDSFETASIRSRVRPRFTSTLYGEPGYAQLRADSSAEILTGAASRAEMGAFEQLMQPQREANLRELLNEYMPYGLQAGLLFVT